MQIYIKGSNSKINLTKNNYVSSGGEGDIYAKNNIAYKIYSDRNKMIPTGKIQELSEITDQNVIRPQDILLDSKANPIGYSMRFVKDNYVLCQLFTKAFRNREGLTHDMVQELVKKLRTMIQHIHSKNILLVDLNEMNFLVNKSFREIYAIDTDSYQTKSFPATAIMDSIIDYHTKGFNQNSDWFSFGIQAFQLFCAIHPFKGKHPSVKSLEDRMRKNISIFNKDVKVPPVVYPIDIIPDIYRQWFKAVFEDGKRIEPPVDFQAVAAQLTVKIQKIIGSDNLDIKELYEVNGEIINVLFNNGKRVIHTDKEFTLNNRTFKSSPGLKIALSPIANTVVLCKIQNGEVKLFNAETQKDITSQSIYGSELLEYQNNIYIKNNDKILKLELNELKDKILPSIKVIANIYEYSTQIFDGCLFQKLLGEIFVSTFPDGKNHRQIKISELSKYHIIDAKYDNNVLMVIGTQINNPSKFDRFIFRFSSDWNTYDIRKVENVLHSGLNFVTLDNGVCVFINENEELELFSHKKNSPSLKVIQDKVISADMSLYKNGIKLMFARDNKLFSMKMK